MLRSSTAESEPLPRQRIALELAREMLCPSLISESTPLLEAHYRELAHYQDIPLDPDYERYYEAQRHGALRIYTARSQKFLIGYAVYVVRPGVHYRGSIQAIEDVIYLEENSRGFMAGVRLLKFADECLKGEGVQVVHHHQKLRHPALGRILERQGYEAMDVIWTKRLDR